MDSNGATSMKGIAYGTIIIDIDLFRQDANAQGKCPQIDNAELKLLVLNWSFGAKVHNSARQR